MTESRASTTTTSVKTGSERLAQLYPHVTDETPLPTRWNPKDKPATLILQQNNLVVTYKGRILFQYES